MRQNLAQKTYDVFTSADNRWIIDSQHEVRSAALERAEELIGERRVEGVRVVAESQRTGDEEILFEEMIDLGEKPVKIVAIEVAPVCSEIGDYYLFPARQAAGRLLRELLDQKGRTVLELAFDYGALRMLERNDSYFPQAIQRVGMLQAAKTGEKASTRNDILYAAFAKIKEIARVTGADAQRLDFLDQMDLAALVKSAPADDAGQRRIHVLGGLSLALQRRGDWSDKISLVIELAEKASDNLLIEFLDGIAAEVLDSNLAITEMFGGFGDSATAMQALVQVTQGRCRINNTRSSLTQFNDLMSKRPMPLTTSLLLDRVARTLGGIRSLTREGATAEKDAFKSVLRELTARAGLAGGPGIAAAVTMRARIVFADPDDLPFEEAIGHVLALLPYRAIRLGFLLDLIASPDGRKNEQAVLNLMSQLVKQLTSLSSLLPDNMDPAAVDGVLEGLRRRMSADELPEKWRNLFSRTLDRLVSNTDEKPAGGGPDTGSPMLFKMEDAPVAEKKEIVRREVVVGEVLFEEGDKADQAYLILEGSIVIYRKLGNDEVVLATLGRGDIVGEMSLIDNQPRMASARVASDTKLTVITRDDLAARLGRLSEQDKVLRRLIDVFVNRLRGQARLFE